MRPAVLGVRPAVPGVRPAVPGVRPAVPGVRTAVPGGAANGPGGAFTSQCRLEEPPFSQLKHDNMEVFDWRQLHEEQSIPHPFLRFIHFSLPLFCHSIHPLLFKAFILLFPLVYSMHPFLYIRGPHCFIISVKNS